jgi:hypothetical protein
VACLWVGNVECSVRGFDLDAAAEVVSHFTAAESSAARYAAVTLINSGAISSVSAAAIPAADLVDSDAITAVNSKLFLHYYSDIRATTTLPAIVFPINCLDLISFVIVITVLGNTISSENSLISLFRANSSPWSGRWNSG